jgi:sodium/proline symporter
VFFDNLNIVAISFISFVALMILVGVLSAKEAQASSEDYLLAGRKVHPWVMALSMLSTNYSGFMFIGYIGYTYTQGISSIWYLVTWALGDLLGWLTIHRRLREKSEARDVNTITSFIGSSADKKRPAVIKVASIISFVFLSVYAAAQLKVSSKALHVMLDWDYTLGIIVAGLIVAVYCFSGGHKSINVDRCCSINSNVRCNVFIIDSFTVSM